MPIPARTFKDELREIGLFDKEDWGASSGYQVGQAVRQLDWESRQFQLETDKLVKRVKLLQWRERKRVNARRKGRKPAGPDVRVFTCKYPDCGAQWCRVRRKGWRSAWTYCTQAHLLAAERLAAREKYQATKPVPKHPGKTGRKPNRYDPTEV